MNIGPLELVVLAIGGIFLTAVAVGIVVLVVFLTRSKKDQNRND